MLSRQLFEMPSCFSPPTCFVENTLPHITVVLSWKLAVRCEVYGLVFFFNCYYCILAWSCSSWSNKLWNPACCVSDERSYMVTKCFQILSVQQWLFLGAIYYILSLFALEGGGKRMQRRESYSCRIGWFSYDRNAFLAFLYDGQVRLVHYGYAFNVVLL